MRHKIKIKRNTKKIRKITLQNNYGHFAMINVALESMNVHDATIFSIIRNSFFKSALLYFFVLKNVEKN